MTREKEATETLLYTFDFPMLTESGSVKITNNQIVLLFPKKPTIYVRVSIKIPRNINVFINDNQRFSLDWIPIHTWPDYVRALDMFEKCLESYSFLTDNTFFHLIPFYGTLQNIMNPSLQILQSQTTFL
jgi:hypothetical protein